jgi:hypothetical protein
MNVNVHFWRLSYKAEVSFWTLSLSLGKNVVPLRGKLYPLLHSWSCLLCRVNVYPWDEQSASIVGANSTPWDKLHPTRWSMSTPRAESTKLTSVLFLLHLKNVISANVLFVRFSSANKLLRVVKIGYSPKPGPAAEAWPWRLPLQLHVLKNEQSELGVNFMMAFF